jgi:glycosyltransferase involved in cell wall biosynthesis
VFCVNDGSTDGTAAILDEYAVRDERVKLLATDHVGAYKARREGLGRATGTFIHFMDSDDILELDAYRQLVEKAEGENLDQIVFASSVFCESDVSAANLRWAKGLKAHYSVPKALNGKVMGGMDLFDKLLVANRFHVGPPLRIIRAETIQDREYGFPEATSRADCYFTPVSLYYARRACAVVYAYYRRRVHNDSVSTGDSADIRHYRNMLRVLAEFVAFPPFRQDLFRPESTVWRYSASLANSLNRWTWKIPDEDRERILRETFESVEPCVASALFHSVAAALRLVKRRPRPTVKDCFVAALRFAWRKLQGRGGDGWYLR